MRFSMPGMPMSIRPMPVRSNWSRTYSRAVADRRSASSMTSSSTWPGHEDLRGPGREVVPGRRVRRCSSMHMPARLVSSFRSSRSSRRVHSVGPARTDDRRTVSPRPPNRAGRHGRGMGRLRPAPGPAHRGETNETTPAPSPGGGPGGPADALRAEQAQAAENARARFLREVQTTAALAHPGIPAVHDTGTDESTGDLFLVMQLLAGAELADLIAEYDYQDRPPPLAWAAAIGAQVATVLTEVHRLSVVHRDIKPRNLFLTPGGIVKVLDFGVAALLGAGELAKLTMVGQTVGTPPYMAPEQALANAVGPPADLYALGCVLHEMLTGKLPFTATGGMSVQWHHVHTPPVPLRTIRPDVPESVEALVLKLLGKSPEERPHPDEVYDTLLPQAWAGTGSTLRDELDPTRPFTRPMVASPRREIGRAHV